jgi:hypothetical protein
MSAVKIACVATVLIGASIVPALAAEECYGLSPFIDVVRINNDATGDGTGVSHTAVTGNWVVGGLYTLPISGARELDVGSSTTKRIGVIGTNNIAADFGGNQICSLDFYVNGNFTIQCSGGAAGNYQISGGPVTKVSCVTAPKSSPGARVAGKK